MTIEEPLFPIVGIGASAGGVQAIEEFFAAFEIDPDIAFVIVTHLSPDHDSLLHEIIARCTTMSVFVVENGMKVVPNCVYVMPPNSILTIEGECLQIRTPSHVRRERNPIDLFLSSLALARGDFAAGIILSGGGADGSLGIKAIREHGGITFAQTPDGTRPAHRDTGERHRDRSDRPCHPGPGYAGQARRLSAKFQARRAAQHDRRRYPDQRPKARL
jgi:two-component system CheB/CheR fusion protein